MMMSSLFSAAVEMSEGGSHCKTYSEKIMCLYQKIYIKQRKSVSVAEVIKK
jgi:hypothetical protein